MHNNRSDKVRELSTALINNYKAWDEGPTRKSWSLHDIIALTPLTHTQEDFFNSYYAGYHMVGYGCTGTGKTLISMWLAMCDVLDKSKPQTRVIIVRSNVATRDVGHLPGTVDEKLAPFETPYGDIFEMLFEKSSTYIDMKSAGLIQFMPTSFIRGQTWDNAVVIVDEFQSVNFHEIGSIISRLGTDSRLIVLGDIKQNDLIYKNNDTSGFVHAMNAFKRMNSVKLIEFTQDDIVRSGICREWIIACESVGI
jgi:predicted ribonuclease YlaK